MTQKVKKISKNQYTLYENTHVWKLVDSAINDLAENQDIKEMTLRKYIVGHISKKIIDCCEHSPNGDLKLAKIKPREKKQK